MSVFLLYVGLLVLSLISIKIARKAGKIDKDDVSILCIASLTPFLQVVVIVAILGIFLAKIID